MKEIDYYASDLFEEAKRFLEKSRDTIDNDGNRAYLHAALLLGISSLEAHINAVSDELAERPNLDLLDKSILFELDFIFSKGQFRLTNKLKMYNLLDRYEYIYTKFSLPRKILDKSSNWWSYLLQGVDLRNSVVHPKRNKNIDILQVENTFEGILHALDSLYIAIYDAHFPSLGRKFDSKMEF